MGLDSKVAEVALGGHSDVVWSNRPAMVGVADTGSDVVVDVVVEVVVVGKLGLCRD